MEKRSGFILHTEYMDILEELSLGERWDVISALMQYFETGDNPTLSTAARIVFKVMAKRIDNDTKHYNEVSEKRKNARNNRAEQNAANVDNAEQTMTNVDKSLQCSTKPYDTDIDTDTDTDTDTDVFSSTNVDSNTTESAKADSSVKKEKDKKEKSPEKRHRYGMYKNVLLSNDALSALKSEFDDWGDRIEKLSEYMESTGKKYKNHLATIRNWARMDGERKKSGNSPPSAPTQKTNFVERKYDAEYLNSFETDLGGDGDA